MYKPAHSKVDNNKEEKYNYAMDRLQKYMIPKRWIIKFHKTFKI